MARAPTDLAQPFYDCIPQENRNKLDKKVDGDHDGVQKHLGEIANAMDEWEGSVADALGLTKVDVANIRSLHRDNLSLQTRAALQKWQERNGFKSTYRNLIVIFLQAGKSSYAEAVCKVLGGDPSQICGAQTRVYASMPAIGAAATQGTRLRTDPHYHNLYHFLAPHADQWRAIGMALGFFPNELSIIQSNVMLLMQGPSGYLSEMITKWLQWAPGDGRRSKNFATYEDLHDALLKVPGTASLAYDLGPALGIQGGNVPPPAVPQPTQPPPPHTNVHPPVHTYASMPTGMPGMSEYDLPENGFRKHAFSVPAISLHSNIPSMQPSTLQSGSYGGSNICPTYQQRPPTMSIRVAKQPLHPGDVPLAMRDHLEIVRAIRDLENRDIIELGQSLGLSRTKLQRKTDLPADMVAAWLRQEDDVIKITGSPTWRTLANACDAVQQGRAAKEIREKHKIDQPSQENLPQGSIPYGEEETAQKPTTVTDGSSPRHSVPDTATGEDSELSEEQMCAQFTKKLQKEWKIVKKDRNILIENGITSDEAWAVMTLDDLKELKLTLGGRKILEARLPKSPPVCKRSFSRELSLEEDAFCPEFLSTLVQCKVSEKDRSSLQENGITTWEAFKDLTSGNFIEMKITMGGRKLLSQLQRFKQQEMAAQAQSTAQSERQHHQPSTFAGFSQATTGNPRSEQQVLQQPNISRKPTELPGTRVTPDHSEPGKSKLVMTGGGGLMGKNKVEIVGVPVFKAPAPVPDGWNPPETDSDGPCKHSSYSPYPRVIKDDRKLKHTPKLKLEEDPKVLTKLNTGIIQLPASLVGNYHMKRACKSRENGHGLALIINNETFTSPRHKQRKGTYRDEYNLVETFRFLGYRVKIHRNCSKEVIEGLFGDISSMIEEEDDSFVCCILSHGSNNIVYGSDSKGVVLRTDDNSLEVKLSNCAKLEGKPKLFFVSTCRVPKQEAKSAHKLEKDGDEDMHELEADNDQNPRADFAFNYATLPGEASWRYTDTGTFYINKLCQVLCENATKATLSDIQKRVAQVVSEMEKHQMPTIEEQTTQNVYFFDDFFENPTVHITTSNPLGDKQ